jgi:hypothetical protein
LVEGLSFDRIYAAFPRDRPEQNTYWGSVGSSDPSLQTEMSQSCLSGVCTWFLQRLVVGSSVSAVYLRAAVIFVRIPPRQNRRNKTETNVKVESNSAICLQSRHDLSMWVEIIAGICLAWYVFIAIVCLIGYVQLYGLLLISKSGPRY